MKKLKKLIDVASGRRKVGLVIKKADIFNVVTEEIYQGDITIPDDE